MAVVVMKKEKKELGVEEIYSRRVGVEIANIETDGLKNIRTVSIGVFIA
jgi:hypothetical protein